MLDQELVNDTAASGANSCDKVLKVDLIGKDKETPFKTMTYEPGQWGKWKPVLQTFGRRNDWFGAVSLDTSKYSRLSEVTYFGGCEDTEIITNLDYPARPKFEIHLLQEPEHTHQIIYSDKKAVILDNDQPEKLYGVRFT